MPETLSGDVELELSEFDEPPGDPLNLLSRWIELAGDIGVREPRALALATTGADGRPSNRIVLLKEIGAGLVFTSHHKSRKGRELDAMPWAAGTLYWRETVQQVNFSGPVQRLSEDESDTLFAARTRSAQAAALVSCQSESLSDPESLRGALERVVADDTPLRRPPDWGGYRLLPERVEFWHGDLDRLHRRLLYTRAGDSWMHQRLQP